MADLKEDRKISYYKCGKCGGMINDEYEVCTECGYSHKLHGTRRVNDIPRTIKLDLNDLNHS